MAEYIIIIPILIGLWFTGLSFVLLVIANGQNNVGEVLFVSAAVIGATRILAYLNKEISQELAKLFPFIAIAVFLLGINAFNFAKIIPPFREVGLLFDNILIYLLVIFLLEVILRLVYTFVLFLASSENPE